MFYNWNAAIHFLEVYVCKLIISERESIRK